MEEKRQNERIQPFVAACRYVVGGQRIPGFLTDLSSGGARIHSCLLYTSDAADELT